MFIDASVKKPLFEGTYLCYIKNSFVPIVLEYDPDDLSFYDITDDLDIIYYPVDFWAEIPSKPKTKEKINDCPFGSFDYTISFDFEEAIVMRENIRFILSYCDVPPYLKGNIERLLFKIKDVLGDNE